MKSKSSDGPPPASVTPNNSSSNSFGGGGCPMQRQNSEAGTSNNSTTLSSFWKNWWRTTDDDNTNNDPTRTNDTTLDSSCPASLEEAARYAQTPQPDQRLSLDTERQVSSIPRGGGGGGSNSSSSSSSNISSTDGTATTTVPHHQHSLENTNHWVYPSEQQLYNAMRRKGYQPPESTIPTVLQIHNHVNERTWRQIQQWEHAHDDAQSQELQLVRFVGRPKDLTPKAWFLCHFLRLYDPPFDRHDWFVATTTTTHNGNDASTQQQQQRYVIDYYLDETSQPVPVPIVDARPALDHPRALYLKARRFFELALPGISKRLLQQQQQQQQQQPKLQPQQQPQPHGEAEPYRPAK